MANYQNLKAAISAAIRTNGNQEITGQVLQNVLNSIVSVIGANYTFAGVATPATNPGTPDQNVMYLAMEGGTYTNFNGTVLPAGISLLMWNGSWTSETMMYGDGGVFDISVYKSSGGTLATFADLAAALNGGNNIPVGVRKGGMSVKFVCSSDNKYIQARCMAQNFTTDVTQWQGVDAEIKAGSHNLAESGGVNKEFGICEDVEISVTNGVAINEVLTIGANKGETYKVKLYSTTLMDPNGVSVHFRKGTSNIVNTVVLNGSTVEVTPTNNCDNICIERSSSGVRGTGDIKLNICSNNGVVPKIKKLQSDLASEISRATGVENSLQQSYNNISSDVVDINGEVNSLNNIVGKEDNFTIPVISGTALTYSEEVTLTKDVTYLVTLEQTSLIDSNGVSINFKNGTTNIITIVVTNGSTIAITPSDNCDNIYVTRYGTGIIGTGNVEISVLPENSLIRAVDKLNSACYISTSGNDNNSGSSTRPFLTINKALEKGFSTILVNAGTYSQSSVDLSLIKSTNIKIAALPNAHVVFYPKTGDYIRLESEVKTEDYTNVYQISTDSLPNDLRFAWQDGVDDVTTLISDAERHPLQRGKEYRLDSTRIRKCSSTQLQSALSEIDNVANNGYRFFFDSDNSVLYYSRPATVDSSHPICIPISGKTFIKEGDANKGKTLELVGIDVRYVPINVTGMIAPKIINCSAKYAYAYGGVMWFNSKGTYIERCESAGTQNGPNGDGFNASAGGSYPTHNSSVLLVDCWGHDNNDDGYSCHQRCEGILQGGLFEYNQKGGVTPAYGEKNLCYNVLSRRNIRGFYYTGTADDGGKYGQSICFGCVSKDNSLAGFVCDGTGNKLIAIGCKSINDVTSYKTPDSNSSVELTDCSSRGATTIKSGNIVVTNTTLVE